MNTKLILTVTGKRDQITVEAKPFTIRMSDGAFCVSVPHGDDWLHTEDFNLGKTEALLKTIGQEWVIEFPDTARLTLFEAWLKDANVKAAEGTKTMWP